MLQHRGLITVIDLAVNQAAFIQRGVSERGEVFLFVWRGQINAVADIAAVKTVAQLNAQGEVIEQRKADVLTLSADKLMINTLFCGGYRFDQRVVVMLPLRHQPVVFAGDIIGLAGQFIYCAHLCHPLCRHFLW